jgi:hypothetical protein
MLSWVGNDIILCEMPKQHGARGAFDGESLALQAGTLLGTL